MRRPLALRFALLLPLCLPHPAVAHPLAPALLAIHEYADGRLDVDWRESRWRASAPPLSPGLPDHCQLGEPSNVGHDAVASTRSWAARCDPPGLVGTTLTVLGLETAPTNVVLRLVLVDGRSLHALLDAAHPTYTVLPHPGIGALGRDYARLGLQHIAYGFDHLLFVFGLVLLAAEGRRIAATVTAFTVGHSITLGLAALGYAQLPPAPIELLIATTLLYLAVELAGKSEPPRWARRRPWAMAASFGLLHGLGFAGALHEIGLPAGDVAVALLAFNLGIELGQLAFVTLLLACRMALQGWLEQLSPALQRLPIEAMGALAGYWCLERLAAL